MNCNTTHYRANSSSVPGDPTLKLLSGGSFASPETKARFEREIEAAATLDHPNVVTVFGSELIDGQVVLAMQWIDGLPFDRWADAQSLSPVGLKARIANSARRSVAEVLAAFAAVCDAVHHAHQRGVIHRDLKPSNILVDPGGRPHVLDFGLAKLDREGIASSEMTLTGAFLGTPAYAAPEQVRGDMREMDVRSDVYSLGAVLYRALTGGTAYDATGGLARLLEEFGRGAPRAPSSMDDRLNHEVDAIVLKTLSVDKALRYGSVEALRADIQRYLDGEPVLAHPPSAGYRARKFLRRHAGVSALGSLTVAAVVTLGIVSTVQAGRERELRGAAEKQEQIALSEAKSQRDTADALLGIVRKIASHAGNRRSISTSILAPWLAEPLNTNTLNLRPDVLVELHRNLSDLYWSMHDYELSLDHDARALVLVNPDDVVRSELLGSMAATLNYAKRYEEAERCAEDALRAAEQAPGRDSMAAAYACIQLFRAQRGLGRLQEAESSIRIAIEIRSRVAGSVGLREEPRMFLADLLAERNLLSEARTILDQGLASLQAGGEGQSKFSAWCLLNLGRVHFRMGEFEQSERHLAELVEYRLKENGLKYGRTCEAVCWHAWALHALGRHDEAIDRLEEALIYREHEVGSSVEVARIRFEMAAAMLAAGREDEGRRQLLRAISKGKMTAPGDPEWDARAAQVETALRDHQLRYDEYLGAKLGDCAWLMLERTRFGRPSTNMDTDMDDRSDEVAAP